MWTALAIPVAAALLASLGEWLHLRRIRRLTALAFGPFSAPAPWTRCVPALRVGAVTAIAWAATQLIALAPRSHRSSDRPEGGYRHLILLLDVSPSMQLRDAGPDGQLTRMQRASEVLLSLFQRVALDQARISVVAFYNGAKPVVIDTYDLEIVRNILDDLPLDQAFDIGKTRVLDGLQLAAEIAKPWQAGSTALLLVTDGDTVPDSGMPALPRSITQTLVIGVGDTRSGRFIDGHQSRQDASTLRQIAGRLQGAYHDANRTHLPSAHLAQLARDAPLARPDARGRRELALSAFALGACILAVLPAALARFGVPTRSGPGMSSSFPTTRGVAAHNPPRHLPSRTSHLPLKSHSSTSP